MNRELFVQAATKRLEEIKIEMERLSRERNILTSLRTRVSIGGGVEIALVEMSRYGYGIADLGLGTDVEGPYLFLTQRKSPTA